MEHSTPKTALGQQVRDLLEETMTVQGFSANSLGRAAGISPSTVVRILHGEGSPSIDTIAILFEAMDLSISLSI